MLPSSDLFTVDCFPLHENNYRLYSIISYGDIFLVGSAFAKIYFYGCIGAILRSFFWPASLARGFSVRILPLY